MSGSQEKNTLHAAEEIVQVKQGKLRGTIRSTVYNAFYISFFNVPYAAPPIGDLRFKDPQPPACWEGIRDANKDENVCCAQMTRYPKCGVIGSEDCLYLNVYKRCCNLDIIYPVMVWIHGGDFLTGSGNFSDMKPDYLIRENIILVSINYRLGALGFLNLGHGTASSNQGLKDQVAALRWIKENIAAFGGDPDNITIFGSGMGAVCAHLLMLSPLSKGLFEKAILQSGVAVVNWTLLQDGVDTNSYLLAAKLGSDSKDPEEVVAFLRTVPVADIVRAQYEIPAGQQMIMGKPIFPPTIDKYTKNPFFPCSYDELLNGGNDIPVILGYNCDEYGRLVKDLTEETSLFVQNELMYYLKSSPDIRETQERSNMLMQTENQLKRKFSPKELNILSVIRFLSNIYFDIPIREYANFRRKRNARMTYFYNFHYKGDQNIFMRNSFWYNIRLGGTSHGDELGYLHYMPKYLENTEGKTNAPQIDTDDYVMLRRLTHMWGNFARTGYPTPGSDKYTPTTWLPATKNIFFYLRIDRNIHLHNFPRKD